MKLPFSLVLKRLSFTFALALVYYQTAEICRNLASTPQNVTPVWAPDGFASAAVLTFGYWTLPGILIGSFLANIWAFINSSNNWTLFVSILQVVAIAIGNSLAPFCGVYLLRKKINKRYPFKRVKDTCNFLVYTGLIAPLVSATIGVTALTLGGKVPLFEYGKTWLTWWISNISGIFIFTPALVSWHQFLSKFNKPIKFKKNLGLQTHIFVEKTKQIDYNKIIELLFLITLILLICLFSFWGQYELEYILIPCLIWANCRFGELEITNLIVLIAILAVTGTVRGLGVFSKETLIESLIFLQTFIGVIVFSMLIFNAVFIEKEQALIKTQISQNELYNRALKIRQYAHYLSQQNIKLEEAKKEAILANQAKSEFLTNISHELRTPLNGILGMAQLFQNQDSLSNKQKEEINIIYESGNHLLMLINDLLDFGKIEAGKMDVELSKFNLINFLKLICDLIEKSAQNKNIYFDYLIDQKLPFIVETDEKKLRQILLNLLGNAVKFTQTGGVKFTVTSMNKLSKNEVIFCEIEFKIEDTGIGIPTDKLDKIFLAFEQVGHNNFKAQGTGLGLAISQKMAHLIGGNIGVASELNQGSIFTLNLTVPCDFNLNSSYLNLGEQNNKFDPELGKKLPFKILIAEDNIVNQKIAIQMFQRLGYKVDLAVNGLEVLRALEKNFYDLIFMDVSMPELDGIEATRLIIKRYSQDICPYIIAMTANVIDGDKEKCLEAGMKDYISKPIKINAIIEALYRVKIKNNQ